MNAWDAASYEGKETILRVVRDEAARLTELTGRPGAWEARPPARSGPSDWPERGQLPDRRVG